MEENQNKATTTSTEKLPTEIMMTTSTAESESFDSWTLVSDAKKAAIASEANENQPSGIELIADELKNHENDDLSDGISIISECESAGRLSPLHSQNHELNDENHNQNNNNNQPLSYEPLTPPNTPDSWRDQSSQTRISRYAELISASSSAIIDEQQGTDDDYDDDGDKIPIPMNSVTPTTALTTKIGLFIRLPMSKLFILSTTIALIAFFGNLKYLSWHEQTPTNLPQLHERLENLELQNNLLRAEIDILSKNLNSINRNQQQNRGGEKFMKKHDKDKVRKNNNGRGDYREYKEPVQNSEKLANEFYDESNLPPSPPPPPPSPPQQQQAIPPQEHQQQVPPSSQPPGLPTYCKDGENLWCSQDPSKTENPTAGATEDNLERPENVINGGEKQVPDGLNEKIHSERREKYEKDSFKKDDYKKQFNNNGKERNDSRENHENKKFDKRREDDYKKFDNSKEQYKNYNHKHENKKFDEKRDKKGGSKGGDSKEKYDKKRQHNEKKKFNDSDYDDDDDDDDDDYDSHEHYSHHHDFKPQDKRYVDQSGDNSRERQRNDSKEHYEKRKNYQKYGKNQKHKKDNDYTDDDDHHHHHHQQNNQSGHDDWHEKMMQHRENIRTKKNHKNDNNWYLERGTGREEARIFEKKEKHDHHHKKFD